MDAIFHEPHGIFAAFIFNAAPIFRAKLPAQKLFIFLLWPFPHIKYGDTLRAVGLISACAEYLHHCDYKEFFVSGIYNVLAARGADLRGFATDLHLPFGTPAEYAQAEQEANKAAFEMLM